MYLSGGSVQVTLLNTSATGHHHRLTGSRRRREGCGRAVALWSLEWWAAGAPHCRPVIGKGSAQCA